jgi:hypothetical protein
MGFYGMPTAHATKHTTAVAASQEAANRPAQVLVNAVTGQVKS